MNLHARGGNAFHPFEISQMISRWSLDAFMKYIRKQIEEFTFDVSQRMLTMQHFRHTPTNATNGSKKEYGGCANLMLEN
jgi:hypothetical protein